MSYPRQLLLRFALYNGLASAFLGAALAQGWLHIVFAADGTYLVVLIAAVFVYGWLLSIGRALVFCHALDQLKERGYCDLLPHPWLGAKGDRGEALKIKLASRIAPIRHIASALVMLGLIGTVVGFIIALSGLDPQAAADINALPAMLGVMIAGMSTALYTTLVGGVLNLWLMVNVRLLEGAAARIVTAYVGAEGV